MGSKESTLLFLLIMLICCHNNANEVNAQDTKKLTIIHTNDTHARVIEGKYDGMGFAKIATLIKQIKAQNENVIILDAGDTFHGQIFATLEKGSSIVKVLNQVGYDAMVLGNHDFNYGQKRLLELIQMADFDVISANIKYLDGRNFVSPYVIKKINDISVGVFGLTTPETAYMTHPNNVAGLCFDNPIEAAQNTVDDLKEKTDVIIALSHLGTDTNNEYSSKLVAKEVKGIDLIVDGHSHSVFPFGLKVKNTLIVSAGEYAKNLGVVHLNLDQKEKRVMARLITKSDACRTEEDIFIKKIIDTILSRQETILLQVIGESLTDLDGERENVRTKETNLGNLITDSMIYLTKAQAAIINGGGIRGSIDKGDITLGQIFTVLPFGNTVLTKKLKGRDIKKALEHGTSKYPKASGAFPHVAQMTYSIDLKRPVGNRIINIKIDGEAIDMDAEYIIATNDFIAAGGDHYKMFLNKETIHEYTALDEGLIEYIQMHQTIAPEIEERIHIIDELRLRHKYWAIFNSP